MHGQRRRLAQDLAQFQAALGADDDLGAARVVAALGVEFAEKTHGAVPHDPVGRHEASPPRGPPRRYCDDGILKHGGANSMRVLTANRAPFVSYFTARYNLLAASEENRPEKEGGCSVAVPAFTGNSAGETVEAAEGMLAVLNGRLLFRTGS